MKLVEVISGAATDEGVANCIFELAKKMFIFEPELMKKIFFVMENLQIKRVFTSEFFFQTSEGSERTLG